MPPKLRGKTASLAKRKMAEIQRPLPTPNWPPLQPLVPISDLALETLLDDQIVVIRHFFTSTLCKNYVSFLSSLPLITTPAQPEKGNALRVNDRIQFDDPAFAEQLWSSTALKALVLGSGDRSFKLWGGEACGLNPRIRIYRYCTYSLTSSQCYF